MNQEKKSIQEFEKMNPEFRNPEGQLLYCTERSGSTLQIKDASGKVQFEIEPSGTQGSTLYVKDAKGSTLGSCRIEPSEEIERETATNTEKEPSGREKGEV